MKFIHLSDLHIGKRVNEFSMLEEQRYILLKILEIIEQEKPDAVLIAGDVYDKSQPSGEAVKMLDEFIFRLSDMPLSAFIISGNHDSAERLSFGSSLFTAEGIHIAQELWKGQIFLSLPFMTALFKSIRLKTSGEK